MTNSKLNTITTLVVIFICGLGIVIAGVNLLQIEHQSTLASMLLPSVFVLIGMGTALLSIYLLFKELQEKQK